MFRRLFAACVIVSAAACSRGSQSAHAPIAAAAPTGAAARSVLVFYVDPEGKGLIARRADVLASPDAGTLATRAIAKLLEPAPADAVSAIPAGVELRSLFFDGKGNAFVDLGHLVEKDPGGTDSEVLALYAVVDTLALNFPVDARRVRVLLDGHEAGSLGHIALDQPLEPRRDLVIGELPAAPPGARAVPTAVEETPPSE